MNARPVEPAPCLSRRMASLAILAALTACGKPLEAAPRFSYTLLDGRRHHSDELRGKVVLVNFWATYCSTCVEEMPALVALHQRLAGRGFDTLAMSVRADAPAAVSGFAAARALPFGVAIDNTGAIARAFGDVQATPTTFVIDRQGRIARQWEGRPDFPALQAQLERLLAAA